MKQGGTPRRYRQFIFKTTIPLKKPFAPGRRVAGEPDNGYTLDWRVNSTYTLSTRLENQDSKISAYSGGNDGNNNFDKGSLTANRLSLLLDTSISNGVNGLVLSASTFYDDVYHQTNDNLGPVNKPGAADEFTCDARRFHGATPACRAIASTPHNSSEILVHNHAITSPLFTAPYFV